MSAQKVEKATIVRLDPPETRITCLFNPKEYSFQKQNTWKPGDTKGQNLGEPEFGSGNPATMTVQLLFDSYESGKDVRTEYTDKLWDLMLVDPKLEKPPKKNKKARPPRVRFHWGEAWSFEAVITSMSQKFTLFLPTGTPVRATVDVTFQQVKDAKLFPKTNPTSGGVGGERVWVVREGETLAWIAYTEYGDSNQWRKIADANNLMSVRQLAPGQVLEIPSG